MTARAKAKDPLVGELVAGRYRIERKIGKGGMGNVYEVSHAKLDRRFALKTLADDLVDDPEALARFRREADVIGRLKHPNIVEVVDWEELDGTPCIVMELLSGQLLADRLRNGPLDWPDLARIADEILSALSMAHGAGIVHRDLKPQNIFLAEDGAGGVRAKLLDFGISKIADSKTFATTDAKMLGTPAYMAPEQADGRQDLVGPKTDVWAMGAILYEMATGATAFAGPSVPAILYRVCHGEPDSLAEQRADAPKAFVELVLRALSHGEDRIENVDALRVGLRRALRAHVPEHGFTSSLSMPQVELFHEASSAAAAAETVAEKRAPIRAPRKRAPLIAAGVVGLLVVGGGIATLTRSSDDERAGTEAPVPRPAATPAALAPATATAEPAGETPAGETPVGEAPVGLPAATSDSPPSPASVPAPVAKTETPAAAKPQADGGVVAQPNKPRARKRPEKEQRTEVVEPIAKPPRTPARPPKTHNSRRGEPENPYN